MTLLGASSVASAQLEDDPAIDSAQVARAVADELAEPKYRLGESWLERLLDELARFWVRFLEWATRASEHVGGPFVAGAIIGGVVITTAILVTANLGRRRARSIDERLRRELEVARGLDPDRLEREALEAEQAGNLATAFRMLFRAGLIRLDRVGRIDLRPGTTSGTLADQIGLPAFGSLVERFDAVAYGGKPARAEDLALVRRVIDVLLEESRAGRVSA